tara:strand:+ start:1336 stop:2910 length:1575 start_codon:yes stop_codon:yes gene_type:complete
LQQFSDDEMSDSGAEDEAELNEAQQGRAVMDLTTNLGLQQPGSTSLQRDAKLVAKLLVYPHSPEQQVPGPWSCPPTSSFPQGANFIGTLKYLQTNAVYPSNYEAIEDLRTFEHWDATRLVPDNLLGTELAHAAQTQTELAGAHAGLGYYLRRDFSACRIFVLGDSHGSLHSMADILLHMHDAEDAFNSWENDDGLVRLQDNVRVVFLGDVLDRSPYTLECLYLVLRLMRENPEKVVFLAGNHETHKWLWKREAGSMHEMEGEYGNRVYVPHFPFQDGRRPMDEVIFDVTKCLPAALIARTPVGVVQFNHGSFEPWLDPTAARARDLNAFKRFATFEAGPDIHPTLEAFHPNRLQWGDLVTDQKNHEAEGHGRAQSTARELRDYLVFMHMRLLLRGHSDMANLSLVYAPGKQPSAELQAEQSVARLPREVWWYQGKPKVDKRGPDKAYPGGTFVHKVSTAHGDYELYDMWTLQPSAGMGDFHKTLIKDGVGAEHPIGVTVSSCPFSRPTVPVEMMSAYLRIDGEF